MFMITSSTLIKLLDELPLNSTSLKLFSEHDPNSPHLIRSSREEMWFQWWTTKCQSYHSYDSCLTFRFVCSEAMSVHARLVKSNPSISACAKTGLHQLYVNVESIAPDHHVMLGHDELSQRCIHGENTVLS